MDLPELPEILNRAGREYYESLLKLGLDPEGLLWAYDAREEEFRLWLVWSGLDKYGPLAISKLLFRAYNASALPKEVDPFSVYVVDPSHLIGTMSKDMHKSYPEAVKKDAVEKFVIRLSLKDERDNTIPAHFSRYRWVYHFQDRRNSLKKVNQDWRYFNKTVEALAA